MHDKHQEFFDKLAEEWDLTFTAEDMERLTHIVDQIDFCPGCDVLDLGCGTGILFDIIRRKIGSEGSVTGVDFSYEMAQKAHRNFPFANVNVVDADAISLPFADSSFDIIVAFEAFPHFSNQQRALDEAHRVLKENGKYYIIHLESSKELTQTYKKVGGAVTDDALPPEDTLREMLENSKFEIISIEDHPGLFLAIASKTKPL